MNFPDMFLAIREIILHILHCEGGIAFLFRDCQTITTIGNSFENLEASLISWETAQQKKITENNFQPVLSQSNVTINSNVLNVTEETLIKVENNSTEYINIKIGLFSRQLKYVFKNISLSLNILNSL